MNSARRITTIPQFRCDYLFRAMDRGHFFYIKRFSRRTNVVLICSLKERSSSESRESFISIVQLFSVWRLFSIHCTVHRSQRRNLTESSFHTECSVDIVFSNVRLFSTKIQTQFIRKAQLSVNSLDQLFQDKMII